MFKQKTAYDMRTWSSDVCSSDLSVHRLHPIKKTVAPAHERLRVDVLVVFREIEPALQCFVNDAAIRSEERRVGENRTSGLSSGRKEARPQAAGPSACRRTRSTFT